MEDTEYMKMAADLAEKGAGRTDPNPLVGAVIVKDGRVIGRGFHRKYGGLHAEREALAHCSESPAGAFIYVTLEPCCHYGKQPPCTDAIIQSGIKKVFVGSPDPNPLVSGKGTAILRDHGIEVVENILRERCDRINAPFFHHMKTGLPWVVMKYAMTMDGRIASRTGASKWITGEEARARVQRDRNRYMAIMAGIGTVIADDPLLTCRLPDARSPVRIICDSRLRIPEDCRIVNTAGTYRTIIAACSAPSEKAALLRARGCEIMLLPERDGHVDLAELVSRLGKEGINSVFLEGGASLNWAALRAGIVNTVQAYVSPMIMGGKDALSPVGGLGADSPGNAFRLSHPKVTFLEDDILIESEVISCSQE